MAAISDPAITKFILISNDTVPLYSFAALYAALMADCTTRGEVAGNNGDRWVGFEPMMQLIRRYTDTTAAPR
jgi:hypothetical protein